MQHGLRTARVARSVLSPVREHLTKSGLKWGCPADCNSACIACLALGKARASKSTSRTVVAHISLLRLASIFPRAARDTRQPGLITPPATPRCTKSINCSNFASRTELALAWRLKRRRWRCAGVAVSTVRAQRAKAFFAFVAISVLNPIGICRTRVVVGECLKIKSFDRKQEGHIRCD